jgi:Xaa-Pro aminopeptidase
LDKLEKIRGILIDNKIDAILISNLSNIRYLSNFTGSNGICLVTHDKQFLITDSRYEIQIKEETKNYKIIIAKSSLFEEIKAKNILKGCKKIGFESNFIVWSTFVGLKELFAGKKWIPLTGAIEKIAAIKTPDEIENIRKAVMISEFVFEGIKKSILYKENELYYTGIISMLHKSFGADGDSFEPIVASGSNSAMPHHRAGRKAIKNNEPVLFDFGAIYKGYGSDITRMLHMGKPGSEFIKIYQIVYDAKKYAIEKVKPGISCKKLDGIARNYIRKKGFGKYFKHSLGHGIGIQNHGLPIVSYRSNEILEENMVITIEPGIYLPGKFGVRIEDDILVRNDGCEVLNKEDGKLIVI